MPDAALNLSHVAKTFPGKVHALRGIDMRVEPGEVFGLLGPNGAGKSTLVKILMTVIRATKCSGTLLGKPVGHKPTLAEVGYLPEHHRFPGYLKGAQVLDFAGAMSGVPRRQRATRAAALLERVDMTAWARKKVGGYSKGMRQRLGIAQALMNDPKLVLLDEPTDGVDPVGRRDIRDLVLDLKNEGRTVFINSHLLSELEMVCDRVAILVQGLVRTQGTIDELTADEKRYEIEVEGDAEATLKELASQYDGTATADGRVLRLKDADAASTQPMIDALRARGVVIRSVAPKRPSLEDLFMQAVGEDDSPGAPIGSRRRDARARKVTETRRRDAYATQEPEEDKP